MPTERPASPEHGKIQLTTPIKTFEFKKAIVRLPVFIGEKRLLEFRFEGLRCDPDIFSIERTDLSHPPSELAALLKKPSAFIYSCPLQGKLKRLVTGAGYLRYVDNQYRHFFLPTTSTFKEYLSAFNSKTRATLLRKERAVANTCTRDYFRVFRDGEGMREFYAEALSVSRNSYQHRLLNQGLPQSDEFLREIVQKADEGRMLGFLLYVKDKPAAYTLGPLNHGVLLYDHTGFNPEYSQFSPGTVLQLKTIETAFNQKEVKIYDLCTGEGKHKELFTEHFIYCGNVYYLPQNLRNLSKVLLKIAVTDTLSALTGILDRLGIKQRLKKFLRSHA
jgi:hypothetical protein